MKRTDNVLRFVAAAPHIVSGEPTRNAPAPRVSKGKIGHGLVMLNTLAPRRLVPFEEEVIVPWNSAPLGLAIDGTALYGVYGGVEYSLWNLLEALHELETPHHFTVFIPHDGPGPEKLVHFGANWEWRRLPFPGISKARRIFWQQRQLPALLRRGKFDLLHAPTYVAPLRSPIPVILGVYDLIALTHPEFATRANRLHYGVVLPRSLRHAAHIIVPSAPVLADVERAVLDQKGQVSVVPLGVEQHFLQPPGESEITALRRRYELPEEYLLYVGNFEPKKNIAALLRAHEMLPQAPPLVIAGGARSWHGHEIASSERVKLLGYVPRRELPALYAGSTAFVFPTLAEGFCLPVLEALAAGAPVITTNHVPLPGIEKVVKMCDPLDASSIAAAIESVLPRSEAARLHNADLREAGHTYAAPFTWRNTALGTLAVYEAVGQGAAARRRS